ncbi:MAG: sulfatase-like hydrolase/transferase [Pseudomonadales bacterium]|nr:sulfatase-like hydrolase/transferase [Pseudomonadales bacterium]
MNRMHISNSTTRTRCNTFWCLLAVALLLLQCLLLYGNTARDDAFFTYWSAWSLTEHGSILNYNGDNVEQSSTLLHTLLLAAAHTVMPFVTIPTLGWFFSLLAAVLTLLSVCSFLQARHISHLPALILAASSSVAFWANSGMETLNATLLYTAILALCLRENVSTKHYVLLTLSCCAAVLNRPESFAVLLCFIVSIWPLQCLLTWSFKKPPHKTWLLALLATAATTALVFLWRQQHFASWLPQPVTAKHSDNWLANIFNGINYIIHGGRAPLIAAITACATVCAAAALLHWKHPHRLSILTCFWLACVQMAFIIATGGDWMETGRFLLPVLPALLLCCVLFLSPWPRLLLALSIPAIAWALQDSWQFARTQSSGFAIHEQRAAVETYLTPLQRQEQTFGFAEMQTKDALRDIPQLLHLQQLIKQLERHSPPLQIASIQMGFIPYHLAQNFPKRLRILDLRALSTTDLTACALLKTLPRTSNGINISYDQFFGLLPSLQRQCGIPKPDILYDLGFAMRKQTLEENGYVITYRETRSIRGQFSQKPIGSDLFVAVRKELAAQYNIPSIDNTLPTVAATINKQRPNIVLVIADDVSYNNFGFMGNAAARTPTLDQLAQQGTVFSTAYVPTAFCRPSLATLLTGQWPHQHRVYANSGVIALPPGTVTLATRLQQQGYATFSGGKFWEDEPDLRGFDAFDNRKEGFARNDQDRLWQFLDQYAGRQPLFIWWAPMLPHRPHNPPQAFLDAIDSQHIDVTGVPVDKQQEFRNDEKRLLAMNLWFDSEFKKLYQSLQTRQQLDNTAFIFMADNGFSHRGASKSTPYELGLRTPLIFYWPGHFPVQRIDAGVDTVNLFRTVLDIANAPQPSSTLSSPLPGHSLLPVIQQQQAPVAEKLFGADYPAFTLKTDPLPRPERDAFALHVRDGDWKYILYLRDVLEKDNRDLTIQKGVKPFPEHRSGDEELFYLPTDRYEANNLASDSNQKTRLIQYRREVLHWWYSTGGKPFDGERQCQKIQTTTALCEKLTEIPR